MWVFFYCFCVGFGLRILLPAGCLNLLWRSFWGGGETRLATLFVFIAGVCYIECFLCPLPFGANSDLLCVDAIVDISVDPFAVMGKALGVGDTYRDLPASKEDLLCTSVVSFVNMGFSCTKCAVGEFSKGLVVPVVARPAVTPVVTPFLILFFLCVDPTIPMGATPEVGFRDSPAMGLYIAMR